jgi:hypothetical protein
MALFSGFMVAPSKLVVRVQFPSDLTPILIYGDGA